MAVNDAILGKQYPALDPYLVGREKIREFARAVMSDTALHTSVQSAQDAGFADLVAPPTFAVIVQERALALLLDDPDSALITRGSCMETNALITHAQSLQATNCTL